MRLFISALLILCINHCANAQWYEAQGHSVIMHGNNEQAKVLAMENALKKALLVAGASVSSVQKTVNGLLTQNEINIRASGTVNSFELIDEIYQGNMVTVRIRADIFPQDKQCFSSDYRKSLLITRSHLQHREQANIGEVYALDTKVMEKLAYQINNKGIYLDTKLLLKNKAQFSRLNNSMQAEAIKSLTMSLANMSDTQYVMYSEINDLSFAQDTTNGWQFWQEDVFTRQFNVSLYIYNGTNGELVFNKTYRDSAPWEFGRRERIDLHSQVFWQSLYGTAIEKVLNDMIIDIDENMMCQPTRGKIVQIAGNTLTINLGKRHGVKLGDEFSLLHLRNTITDSGKTYAGFNVSPYTVKVTQVSQESAKAIATDESLLGNIQLADLAVRY
ncbi:MAG: flagellar assembly protein T N-terminal domain-containing protein [Colwellia sp.]|nr:flagellar assembly protein T N-terminal domain-containing protein [Colwellia sp.]